MNHRSLLALLLTTTILVATPAFGDDINWTNVLGGDFEDPANWSPSQTPGVADAAIFDLATVGYTVTSSQDQSVFQLLVGTDVVTLSLGSQSLNVGGDSAQRLRVADGDGDVGTLRLTSGTVITTGLGVAAIGGTAGSTGLLEIDGPQARLEIVGTYNENQIGSGVGAGELRVLNGAQFVAAETGLFLARNGGTGVVKVEGAGSNLTTGTNIAIGLLGDGELFVRNAAQVNTGAQIQVGGAVITGAGGNGILIVDSGGRLNTSKGTSPTGTSGIIAFGVGGSGQTLISGLGSQWLQDGNLGVGWRGTGRLDVQQSGFVESQRGQIGRLSTGNGTVSIVDAGSRWNVAEDLTVGGTESAQGGQGGLNVGLGGKVVVGQTLRSWQSGTIDVTGGGTIEVGNVMSSAAAGSVLVGPGGTLSGSGTILGDVVIDGGTVTPGNSPGALHITGNYNQLLGSLLFLEVGGLSAGTEYDQLLVTGDLALAGAVEIFFSNNFLPQVGDTFDLFSVGGDFVAPDMLSFLNPPAGFEYSAGFDSGVFSLTVTAVPEPTTLWLCSISLLVAFHHRSKLRLA